MLINGLEIESDDFQELRYLVDWKTNDLEEQMKDNYYDNYPDELADLNDELNTLIRIRRFLSDLQRGAK